MFSNKFWKNYKFKSEIDYSNIEYLNELALNKIQGIVSGNSVWISVDKTLHGKLESIVFGLVEVGKDLTQSLKKLLTEAPLPPILNTCKRNNCFDSTLDSITYLKNTSLSISNDILIRLGAEEALFLAHVAKCLHVYKGSGTSDAWAKLVAGVYSPLYYLTGDELFNEFIKNNSLFLHRYLSYLNYRSKGWIVRSGIQFGSDFLLYQFHPTISHSCFALLLIPTAIETSSASFAKKWCKHTTFMSSMIKYNRTKKMKTLRLTNSVQLDPKLSWSEISSVVRLEAQVRKRLMLFYIAILEQTEVRPTIHGVSLCYQANPRESYLQINAEQYGCVELEDYLDRAFSEEIVLKRWRPL
jgi:tRNA-splicing endonuclease subunit Sen2